MKTFQVSAPTLEGAVATATTENQVLKYCFEHTEEELKLYCETCQQLICLKCAVKGGKHQNCDYRELNEAYEKYKAEIDCSLNPLEKQISSVNKALKELNSSCSSISDQQAAIEADISGTFQRIQDILDSRKAMLICQLNQITQGKLKGLAAQRDKLETTQARLRSCLHFMKESLKGSGQREVLQMKATIVKQVEELTTAFQLDDLKPDFEADMTFLISKDIAEECQHYGLVTSLGLSDPSKCHVLGEGLEVALVGEKSVAVVETVNINFGPCKERIRSFECELVTNYSSSKNSDHTMTLHLLQCQCLDLTLLKKDSQLS